MDKTVQDFLSNDRIAVLGILQDDNSVHSASLHYAHTDEPLVFYFLTERESRKCRPLIRGQAPQASLVVGFSEEIFKTFQAEGTVAFVDNNEQGRVWEIYLQKFPDNAKWKDDEDMVLLKFTPTWWRYRDYKAKPLLEISSEN